MKKRYKKIWIPVNKPKVDWAAIVDKCRSKFKWPSEGYNMGFSQAVDFAYNEILEYKALRYTGKSGHKKPIHKELEGIAGQIMKDVNRKHNRIIRETGYWDGPQDLLCADPLYDGEPIF